jgi:hypothetical protein
MPERRFQGPWRVDAPVPPGTEDYPGLVVCEGYRRGSIRTKDRGLELWCWVYELITQADWDGVNRDYEPGIDPDEFARFLVNLLNQRGEFGRLVCVLADVERDDDERVGKVGRGVDRRPWWEVPDQRARVRHVLLECVAALDEEEADDE